MPQTNAPELMQHYVDLFCKKGDDADTPSSSEVSEQQSYLAEPMSLLGAAPVTLEQMLAGNASVIDSLIQSSKGVDPARAALLSGIQDVIAFKDSVQGDTDKSRKLVEYVYPVV